MGENVNEYKFWDLIIEEKRKLGRTEIKEIMIIKQNLTK